MDFSEAERLGFIDAFTEFWQLQPGNSRSIDELKAAGQALLKGCREHFRAGVTRVSRISAAVDPSMADYFVSRALALLDAPNSQEFIARAELVISEYPKLTAWMKWWTRPAHAAMLCDSERKMDIELWESLPDTNNAEEAMHWKLYSACGRDHDVFGGLKGLYAVAKYYERMYNSVLSACFCYNKFGATEYPTCDLAGIRTHYGEKEPWKVLADNIGRTKNSRAPDPSAKKRKRNDGRAPDTSKEILKKPTKRKKVNNDGRPPDTVKALKLTKSSKKDAHPQKRQTRIQSRKPKLGKCTGRPYPHGSRVRVLSGTGTGQHSPTRYPAIPVFKLRLKTQSTNIWLTSPLVHIHLTPPGRRYSRQHVGNGDHTTPAAAVRLPASQVFDTRVGRPPTTDVSGRL
jgi:hypothetical protein